MNRRIAPLTAALVFAMLAGLPFGAGSDAVAQSSPSASPSPTATPVPAATPVPVGNGLCRYYVATSVTSGFPVGTVSYSFLPGFIAVTALCSQVPAIVPVIGPAGSTVTAAPTSNATPVPIPVIVTNPGSNVALAPTQRVSIAGGAAAATLKTGSGFLFSIKVNAPGTAPLVILDGVGGLPIAQVSANAPVGSVLLGGLPLLYTTSLYVLSGPNTPAVTISYT